MTCFNAGHEHPNPACVLPARTYQSHVTHPHSGRGDPSSACASSTTSKCCPSLGVPARGAPTRTAEVVPPAPAAQPPLRAAVTQPPWTVTWMCSWSSPLPRRVMCRCWTHCASRAGGRQGGEQVLRRRGGGKLPQPAEAWWRVGADLSVPSIVFTVSVV